MRVCVGGLEEVSWQQAMESSSGLWISGPADMQACLAPQKGNEILRALRLYGATVLHTLH